MTFVEDTATPLWRQQLKTIAPLAAMILIIAACGSSTDDAETATTATTASPVTQPPPTTTKANGISVDDALSVADSYFEAYNTGDVDTVLGLFVPDATFFDNFGPRSRTYWEQLLVFNAASGTILSSPDCTVAEEVSGDSVTVSCPHENLDVLVQAVDGPPVPIKLRLVVTPNGISEWKFLFGDPNFNAVGVPFTIWMAENHPEDANALEFGNWNSISDAEQNGTLMAQYANEWGAEIEAGDCNYLTGC